jgi:hypothetical protein
MPTTPPPSHLRQATRGIVLLTGLGLMTLVFALAIAAVTVALVG